LEASVIDVFHGVMVENILKMESQATVRDCLHLLIIMASCIELIPNARLFMRPIQLHLLFEKSLFCLGDPRTRFWKRLLSMCFMELWTCLCLDFTVSTTILDDFLKVSKKELLLQGIEVQLYLQI
jgi:hypothetical protein